MPKPTLIAWTPGKKFQSAPGREAGRCLYSHGRPRLAFQFQSAPGREAGRCVVALAAVVARDQVSIRARP